MIGATTRQGPHQGAQKSTRTGSSEASTMSRKVASLTVIGPLVTTTSGDLQLPHFGCNPLFSFSASTRFSCPHWGHRTILCVSAMCFVYIILHQSSLQPA